MVDANKNGIPDNLEVKGGPNMPFNKTKPKADPQGAAGLIPKAYSVLADPARQVGNFVGSIGDFLGSRGQAAPGGGLGDKLWGAREQLPSEGQKVGQMQFAPGMAGPGQISPQQDPFSMFHSQQSNTAPKEKSFADYLAMASQMGAGQSQTISGVNYDPQRQTLRNNASENDARLAAMYRQLQGSIQADAPKLQQTYADATAGTNAATQNAQAQTQAASDSATQRNDQVLANLGIQAVQGNQIQEGRDLASQTAATIGDQASRGQAAATRLSTNEAAALANNQNIGSAAGLEGNLQRATNQANLQKLLSQIDMQEQQQNASLSQQRASQQDGSFSRQLQLANQLYGFETDKQNRQDSLMSGGAKMAMDRQKMEFDQANKMRQDPIALLDSLGITTADVKGDPGKYGQLLAALQKYAPAAAITG